MTLTYKEIFDAMWAGSLDLCDAEKYYLHEHEPVGISDEDKQILNHIRSMLVKPVGVEVDEVTRLMDMIDSECEITQVEFDDGSKYKTTKWGWQTDPILRMHVFIYKSVKPTYGYCILSKRIENPMYSR